MRESNQQIGSSFSSSSSSSFSSSKAAIELSDSDNEQEEEDEGRGRGGGNVSHSNVRGEGGRAHRTEDEEDDDEEKQQWVDVPWWQRKWRARLVSEKESGWHLARLREYLIESNLNPWTNNHSIFLFYFSFLSAPSHLVHFMWRILHNAITPYRTLT